MTNEKTLLGGIIKTPFIIDLIAAKLNPSDFVNKTYQEIYKRILDIYNNKGYFDFFTLDESFADEAMSRALIELTSTAQELETAQALQYVAKIKEERRAAALKNLGSYLVDSKNYANSKADDIIRQVSRQLFSLSETQLDLDITSEDIVKDMKTEMELYKGKELWGYPTGFKTLDKVSRGLQKGHVWVVGAYTSVGKSWFCLNLANSALRAGASVLYVSTEMVEKRLAWRFLAVNTGLSEYSMIKDYLTPESREKRDEWLNKLPQLPIRFVSGISKIDEVVFYVKRELAARNCDVVVVDFLQNVATGKDEYEELSDAIRRLQTLAIKDKVCVVVASQVNRESQKGGPKQGFGYKGSGTIEAAADIGIELRKDPETRDFITVDVKKNRNGITAEFQLFTDYSIGEMTEVDHAE